MTHSSIIISKSVFRNCFSRFFKFAIIFIILLLVNTGCNKRKPETPTPDIQINEQYWIRVLLLNNIQQCSIQIESHFSIKEENRVQNSKSKKDYKPLKEPVIVQIIDGQINIAKQNYPSNQIIISPKDPYIFSLNGKSYRGKVRLIAKSDANSFDVINLVPLESYIAGVAGAEMPDYWEPEALKCQAIAARTYCLFIKKRFGENRTWDLNKTAAHQVYLGMEAESPAVWQAVNETHGIVLTCRQPDGTEDIFPTYYSSACGGHTEDSENVFGDSYESLKGVPCTYCKDVAKEEIFFWPDVQFEKDEVYSRLMNRYPNLNRLGEVKEISVDKQSDFGEFSRITRVKISGPNNISEFLRAEDFRLVIDPTGKKIKSAVCTLEESETEYIFTNGRGWGHGVGICQCGVQGMARQGKSTEEILSHYYPDSKYYEIDYNK
ncbi:MAG: SpoIID/LytB domain-containing protein [Sedimentisphaerales bacterium]|nr:SpoIID/LytB domain-containing protein [Sedimentisphaerales bacterium]